MSWLMISVLVLLLNFSQRTCAEFGIVTKGIPRESQNSLEPGERYHAPLRKIYRKLKEEQPELDPCVWLSSSVRALNNTANPRALIPSLLVFAVCLKYHMGIFHIYLCHKKRFAALASSRKRNGKNSCRTKTEASWEIENERNGCFQHLPRVPSSSLSWKEENLRRIIQIGAIRQLLAGIRRYGKLGWAILNYGCQTVQQRRSFYRWRNRSIMAKRRSVLFWNCKLV